MSSNNNGDASDASNVTESGVAGVVITGVSGESDVVDRSVPISPGPTFAELVANSVAADAFGNIIDSAVSGLRYRSGGHYGVTDSEGRYGYILGESVEFFIGDIAIGFAIQPLPRITPYELGDGDGQTALNIARFLQTLDNDADPDNGIHINEAVHALAAGISVDFSSTVWQVATDSALEMLIFELTSATEAGAHDLVSAKTAYYHMASTLNNVVRSLGDEAESLLASSTCTVDSQCKWTQLSSSASGPCPSADKQLVYSEVDADIPAFNLLEGERVYLIGVREKLKSSAGPFDRIGGLCASNITVTYPVCGESNHCEITTSVLGVDSPPIWQF